MSLWNELKRRNVLKVGATYAVVAWLLVQVAATVSPQLHLPEWAPRLVTLLLMLGFPIALLIAWFLERTERGIEVEPAAPGSRRVVLVAIALGALAVGWFVRETRLEQDLGPATTAAPTAAAPASAGTPSPADDVARPPKRSIAVLAFANLSDDKGNEYLADGLSEEILNALAQIRDLKVAGRTSSFHYKGRNEDLRTIGRALGVAHVLEGSVRRQGDRVRITAQLVHADNGFHVWSDTYDGGLDDVFALQERVARAVSDALEVTLSDAQQARLVDAGTSDTKAYAHYLEAAAAYRRRDGDLFPDAIEKLERALAIDPSFARAAAMIATTQALLAARLPLDSPEAAAARERAKQASELDPRLAQPYIALGLLAAREGRFVDARDAYTRAVELAPRDVDAAFFHARHLLHTGYLAAGTAALDRALLMDSAHPNALWRRALLYLDAGDLDAAERAFARARELGLSWSDQIPLELARARGDWPAVRRLTAELRPDAGDPCMSPSQARIVEAGMYGGSPDERAAALAAIEACLAQRPPVMPGLVPRALFRLGAPERALQAILAAPSSNQPTVLNELWGTEGRDARRLPQFAAFARASGYAAVWDRHGEPDRCRRLAPGEYACD